jgi:C-terminal processing protease CtpA/Prc
MRFLLLALLLASPVYSQEAWLDNTPEPSVVIDETIVNEIEYVDPLADALDEIKSELASLRSEVQQIKPPTIDEIRSVVREELDRVTVTLKTASGEVKHAAVPLSKTGDTKITKLQEGDRIIAIDGKPVTPYTFSTAKTTGQAYSAGGYEMRVLNGVYGAVRQSTCRMVNGKQVCN